MLVLLVGFAFAGEAQAQIKCWTGIDGKRACGDLPPPGARLETPRGAPVPVPKDPAPAATDVKKGTSASSPQDQDNRRRPAQSQNAAAKSDLEKVHSGNIQECERARETLRQMGGGGRSMRTDAVRARALADQNCGG